MESQIDLRDFGNSYYYKQVQSVRAHSEDIKIFAEVLGITSLTFVGLDYGAYVGEQLPIDRPDLIKKLILVDALPPKGFLLPLFDEQGQLQQEK